MEEKEFELYIHIPFCARKCRYCDFLSFPAGRQTQLRYLEALKREMREMAPALQQRKVCTIFFGGGTPGLLPAEDLEDLLGELRTCFRIREDAEISLECNPGVMDREKPVLWQKAGFNRISLGLQSADNRELQLLGRIHTWEQFLDNYQAAREAGFTNINIDLMSSLPGQNRKTFRKTLEKVLELSPQHLSVYSLIIEPGTPFYEAYHEDAEEREKGNPTRWLPDEEEEYAIYKETRQILKENGYQRYEISNYALPGQECRHNLGYWSGVDYLGLGLGAASLMDGVRFTNTRDLKKYLDPGIGRNRQEEVIVLTEKDRMEEYMFLGLRKLRGVSVPEFQQRFAVSMQEVYGKELQELKEEGLLQEKDGMAALTDRGLDLANYCMAKFLR